MSLSAFEQSLSDALLQGYKLEHNEGLMAFDPFDQEDIQQFNEHLQQAIAFANENNLTDQDPDDILNALGEQHMNSALKKAGISKEQAKDIEQQAHTQVDFAVNGLTICKDK